MTDQVLLKSLLRLDPYDSKPQIATKKYITPMHLGEYSTASFYVEIIIYNHAFFEDHQSIFHALPPLVVETCVMHVFFSIIIIPLSNIKF